MFSMSEHQTQNEEGMKSMMPEMKIYTFDATGGDSDDNFHNSMILHHTASLDKNLVHLLPMAAFEAWAMTVLCKGMVESKPLVELEAGMEIAGRC